MWKKYNLPRYMGLVCNNHQNAYEDVKKATANQKQYWIEHLEIKKKQCQVYKKNIWCLGNWLYLKMSAPDKGVLLSKIYRIPWNRESLKCSEKLGATHNKSGYSFRILNVIMNCYYFNKNHAVIHLFSYNTVPLNYHNSPWACLQERQNINLTNK